MSAIKEPVTVEIDIPVTRRTKIHAVYDGNGDQVFHSRRISQVFDYLLEHSVQAFELLDDDVGYLIGLSRPLPPAHKAKGPTNG